MILYRYQPINKLTLINLSKQKNWVADPLEFNDPFEFHLKEEYISQMEESKRKILGDIYKNREKIKRLISNFGVVCYSKNYDNKLMWSHYANSHKGICLAFEIPQEQINQGFVKVEYSKNIPDCSFDVDRDDNWSRIITIVKNKALEWKYEDEYRQVFTKKKTHSDYPGKLVEVIFGSQSTRSDIDLVLSIVKSHHKRLEISKMYLTKNSFDLGKISFIYSDDKEYWIPDNWDGKCIK